MVVRFRAVFLLLTLFLSTAVPSRAADEQPEGEPAILEIIVNGYNEGQQFVRVTQDGDVLLSPQLLEDLRLQPELWAGQSQGHISLRSLIPKIQFTLDQNSALLNVAVPAKWFQPQLVRDEKKYAVPEAPAEGVLSPQHWAGFLNYTLQVNFSEQEGGLSGVSLPWELGFNYKQWFVQSTFSSQYDPGEETVQMDWGNFSVLRDYPESMHSLVFGDFSPPSGMMGGGGSLTGISWRKNYRLDRTFHYDAELNLTLDVDSPVHAQLYSNGREVQGKEWDLLPGVITFEDVAAYVSGDAELLLTDAFGREQRLKVPSFTGQNILKKGVHEYAYSLGWQQGTDTTDYGDPVTLGYHLYGFAETWTGGGSFAVTEDSFAVGPMLSALLGGFSQLETGFLVAQNEEEFGYTGTARYSFRHKKINGYLGLSGFSREYSPVPGNGTDKSEEEDEKEEGDESSASTTRYQGSLSLSYSDMDWGGLSFGYAENGRWNGEDSRSLSLTYRKSLFKGLHLTVGVKHDFSAEDNDSIRLTLRYSPENGSDDGNWYDRLNAETRYHQVDGWETTAGLDRSYSEDTGYGYSANMSRKEDKVSAALRGQHKNAHGIYTAAAHFAEDGGSTGSLSAAGSLALLDWEIYHSQPITDSFAVVQVEGLYEVTVKGNGRIIGKAGTHSTLLVPNLNSYSNNSLSIDALNLPLNFNAAVMEQEVEVQQRSGSLVAFVFTRFSAVEGELFQEQLDDKGEKTPVEEALPLELTFNGEKNEGFTGRGGYFYLENVPVGAHTLRLYQPGGYCLAQFTVPDTEKIVVNLGELSCVKEQDGESGK